MKKTVLSVFIAAACAVSAFALDPIYYEERTTNTNALITLHASGVMAYGAHTNTFNVRNYFVKAEYDVPGGPIGDVSFFATFNGYRDTHVPETNYGYILGNVNLYDCGLTYWSPMGVFCSLRGAAVLRPNLDTLLLIPSYYYNGNPGEFDTPAQYQPLFLNAAGIRVGFTQPNWEIAYSQGDYRHSIPIAVHALFRTEGFTCRAYVYFENDDPLVYAMELWTVNAQLSAAYTHKMGDVTLKAVGDCTYILKTARTTVRLEAGASWMNINVGLRALYTSGYSMLFEGSVAYDFLGMAQLGFFASSDGRVYFGDRILF